MPPVSVRNLRELKKTNQDISSNQRILELRDVLNKIAYSNDSRIEEYGKPFVKAIRGFTDALFQVTKDPDNLKMRRSIEDGLDQLDGLGRFLFHTAPQTKEEKEDRAERRSNFDLLYDLVDEMGVEADKERFVLGLEALSNVAELDIDTETLLDGEINDNAYAEREKERQARISKRQERREEEEAAEAEEHQELRRKAKEEKLRREEEERQRKAEEERRKKEEERLNELRLEEEARKLKEIDDKKWEEAHKKWQEEQAEKEKLKEEEDERKRRAEEEKLKKEEDEKKKKADDKKKKEDDKKKEEDEKKKSEAEKLNKAEEEKQKKLEEERKQKKQIADAKKAVEKRREEGLKFYRNKDAKMEERIISMAFAAGAEHELQRTKNGPYEMERAKKQAQRFLNGARLKLTRFYGTVDQLAAMDPDGLLQDLEAFEKAAKESHREGEKADKTRARKILEQLNQTSRLLKNSRQYEDLRREMAEYVNKKEDPDTGDQYVASRVADKYLEADNKLLKPRKSAVGKTRLACCLAFKKQTMQPDKFREWCGRFSIDPLTVGLARDLEEEARIELLSRKPTERDFARVMALGAMKDKDPDAVVEPEKLEAQMKKAQKDPRFRRAMEALEKSGPNDRQTMIFAASKRWNTFLEPYGEQPKSRQV